MKQPRKKEKKKTSPKFVASLLFFFCPFLPFKELMILFLHNQILVIAPFARFCRDIDLKKKKKKKEVGKRGGKKMEQIITKKIKYIS